MTVVRNLFFPKHLHATVRNYYILECEIFQLHATLTGQGKVSKTHPLAEAQKKEQETAAFPSSGNYLPLRRSKGSHWAELMAHISVCPAGSQAWNEQGGTQQKLIGHTRGGRWGVCCNLEGGREDLVFLRGPLVLDINGSTGNSSTVWSSGGQHWCLYADSRSENVMWVKCPLREG